MFNLELHKTCLTDKTMQIRGSSTVSVCQVKQELPLEPTYPLIVRARIIERSIIHG